MKNYLRIGRLVATFGQLGFTLITPPVVMAVLGWWLQSRFGLGTWVMLVCLLVGFLCAGANGCRFLRQIMVKQCQRAPEEEDRLKNTVVYYTHE